jgi:hypothetical protein
MLQTKLPAQTSRPPYGPALIVVGTVVAMACLFAASYSLVLGRPKPHEISTALVSNGPPDQALIRRIERAAGSALDLHAYPSADAARRAIEDQHVYAALVLEPKQRQLLVASASGASVARVLEQAATRYAVAVVDVKPLPPGDPSGLVPFYVFYVELAATLVGYLTMVQLRANAPGLSLHAWLGFVVGLAVVAGLALSVVSGPLIGALGGSLPEKWAILALDTLAAALFNSTMLVLIGPWALVPTYLLFIVLGSTSSGGAVAPPLLPPFFAFIGQWLPPGATVNALRNAVYFPTAQYREPFVVLVGWGLGGAVALLVASRMLARTPAQ